MDVQQHRLIAHVDAFTTSTSIDGLSGAAPSNKRSPLKPQIELCPKIKAVATQSPGTQKHNEKYDDGPAIKRCRKDV